MKLIIAGSRAIEEFEIDQFEELVTTIELDTGEHLSEIVSGCCPTGIDRLSFDYWEHITLVEDGARRYVRLARFPADWETHGKAAGPIRNKEMAEYADALLLIWDGKSRGSASMLHEAQKAGLVIVQVVL